MVDVTPLQEVVERLRVEVVRALRAGGYTVPPRAEQDIHQAVIAWFRVDHRSIAPQPRTVEWSNQFRSRVFEPWVVEALSTIEAESVAGVDLNPRLTRSFFKAGFNDLLLSDLGVQHFHLGAHGAGKNGQTGGTKELLFAFVQPERIYFLDVLDHDAFSNEDFFRCLRENWPELLTEFEMPGLRSFGDDAPTPKERAEARAAGVTILTGVGGKVLGPPGGGIATDGTSTIVVDRAAEFIGRLGDYHDWVVENADALSAQVRAETGVAVDAFDLTARYEAGEIAFEDLVNRLALFPRDGRVLVLMR